MQAGLFSAVVTAFLIESYKGLSEDTDSTTVALLAQISAQLGAMANSSQPFTPQSISSRSAFSPSASSLAVNAMWFLSLSLSLACALAAMLVQHWGRNYSRSVEQFQHSPHKRGLIRAFMFEGLVKSHLGEIVELIPILIHASLFLFLAGLVIFLHEISLPIAYLVLSTLVTCSILYSAATLFPLLHPESPLHTPLLSALWYTWRYAFKFEFRPVYSISQLATGVAELQHPRAQDRVADAIRWTLHLAKESNQFEDFLVAIPGFALWQHPVFVRVFFQNTEHLLLLSSTLIRTLVTQPRIGTAVQPRHAQCLQGVYTLAAHSLPSEYTASSVTYPLAKYLSSCDSGILSLVFCTMFASITNRGIPPIVAWPQRDLPPAASKVPANLDALVLDIGHSIDQMLGFKLGLSPSQALKNVASAPSMSDEIFHPFKFVIRTTLPAVDEGLHIDAPFCILIEAIWEAAEESQGHGSFQQITFVHFLNNLLSAYSYLVFRQSRSERPFPTSIRTLLPVLLKATGSLSDETAIAKAVVLLSKYSQANPDRYLGVHQAKTSLECLRERLRPDSADNMNGKESHFLPSNEPSALVGFSGFVHRYDPPGSYLPGLSRKPGVWDSRSYNFHTDWFDTYTFPEIEG
jgi:hypothetical protein